MTLRLLTAIATCVGFASPATSNDDSLLFERDIRPILKQHCFHCHGEEPEKHGGLDVRTVKSMLRGGESGPVLVAGSADGSHLWQRVFSDEMPEGTKKVPADQKQKLQAWIEQGARTARDEPDDPELARFTEEELSHWAFQPVRRPDLPSLPERTRTAADHPIDAFILSRLSAAGITQLSPEADRRTLIRRATFDLLGRPPTPSEVEEFLADDTTDAFAALVDRLLASPQYGERWARHWLDVAGYAETDGGVGPETERPHAWRYRDYVVNSLNADKPYNEFLVEQLAGDELAVKPYDISDPRTLELLTATGFLRMPPDVTQTSNTLMDRNQAVADVVKVVGSAVLGLTVGCAQCHDHKYDPIAAEDYYRVRAVFDPAFNIHAWQQPGNRLIDITPADVIAAADAIEVQAAERDKSLHEEMTEAARQVFERELARVPEDQQTAVRTAIETAEGDRTDEQKALLLEHPNVKTIDFIRGFFVEYDRELHARFNKAREEIAAIRATRPPRQYIAAAFEPAGPAPESRLMFRGDPEQPKQTVAPGELTVLDRGQEFRCASPEGEPSTSGRRLAYARWLTRDDHPLVARVMVNRVWLHHFGRGLVGTPGDFGLNGETPTHPDLLDWLASEFVAEGWSLKTMHRLLMTSATYRQRSLRTPELDVADPDNHLLGRTNLRRLEAEAVRDALLAVSGQLSDEVGGMSTPITEDGEGQAVFGRRQTAEGLFSGVAGIGRDEFRRSLYLQSRRALPLSMLEVLDLPAMTPNCDQRRNSTVATQSLLFMNNEQVWKLAELTAERIAAERPAETERQIQLAYLLLFGSEPAPDELAACREFVAEQTTAFRDWADDAWKTRIEQNPSAAEQRALAALCQTLICSNRFLYLD
ncbi:MAG: PSD1 domain-containing protein [Planctomyces sp.]|nr:PSD1 domain-containing protein [Planctomyces sp.]